MLLSGNETLRCEVHRGKKEHRVKMRLSRDGGEALEWEFPFPAQVPSFPYWAALFAYGAAGEKAKYKAMFGEEADGSDYTRRRGLDRRVCVYCRTQSELCQDTNKCQGDWCMRVLMLRRIVVCGNTGRSHMGRFFCFRHVLQFGPRDDPFNVSENFQMDVC